jgi:predicted DNA-binding WGR domain protein
MIAQPCKFYIERVDPAQNMARYYALSIEPTLFGEASVLRRWGRASSRGQQKLHLFADERRPRPVPDNRQAKDGERV